MSGISKFGDEWSYVKIKHQPLNANGTKRGDPEVECLQCGHMFRGGASRIRSHLLGTKDGVSACEKVSEEDSHLAILSKAGNDMLQRVVMSISLQERHSLPQSSLCWTACVRSALLWNNLS